MKHLDVSLLLFVMLGACGAPAELPGDGAVDALFFSNIRVEDQSGDRAVVRFDTALPTTCEASYGLAEPMLDATATDPDMEPGRLVVEHQVPLENLQPLTTYWYRARAEDERGRVHLSEVRSFTTSDGDAVLAMTNVARAAMGTTVVQTSSNWDMGANDSLFGANNVTDGDMYTEWSSNGDGDGAYILLDFGQRRSLTHFGFRSRKMRDGSSITTSVRLLFEGGAVVLGPFETPDPDHRYAFGLGQTVNAQTVRLEVVTSSGGNTGAKEIQFFVP